MEGWLKKMAQLVLWEVERERMEEVAAWSQWLAEVLSVWGQNQSRPRTEGLVERKRLHVGSACV